MKKIICFFVSLLPLALLWAAITVGLSSCDSPQKASEVEYVPVIPEEITGIKRIIIGQYDTTYANSYLLFIKSGENEVILQRIYAEPQMVTFIEDLEKGALASVQIYKGKSGWTEKVKFHVESLDSVLGNSNDSKVLM